MSGSHQWNPQSDYDMLCLSFAIFTLLKHRYRCVPGIRCCDSLDVLGVPAGGRIWHNVIRGSRRLRRSVTGWRFRRSWRDDLAGAQCKSWGPRFFLKKMGLKKSRKSTQIDSIDFDLSRFGALVQLIKILQPSWKKLTLPWPGQRAHEEVLPLGLASLPWKLCHRRKRRNMEKVWVTGRITANKTLANFADNEWFHHETKSKLAKD